MNRSGYFANTRVFVYSQSMRSRKKKFDRALEFVKKKHKGQFRAAKSPAWHHLLRVSSFLDSALKHTKEGKDVEKLMIPLAALGHDLLEDTKAEVREIKKVFGERGHELIRGMTNHWGDKHVAPYVRQVARSEEAVRLIKLSDLYDNVSGAAHNAEILGLKWINSYFLPIVLPMWLAVRKTKFIKYKKTAMFMIAAVTAAFALLSETKNKMED